MEARSLTSCLADIGQGRLGASVLSFCDTRTGVGGLSELNTVDLQLLRWNESSTGTKGCWSDSKNITSSLLGV